jgi:glutamine amidotransferase/cyclase
MITLLDYGAGNVRSVINAIERLGESVQVCTSGEDILAAEKLVFPGVGAFGRMMEILQSKNFVAPLQQYLRSGRPFLGICLGMQALFDGSEEAPGISGLGFMKGLVKRFQTELAVPHIGWNGVRIKQSSRLFNGFKGNEKFYFVH